MRVDDPRHVLIKHARDKSDGQIIVDRLATRGMVEQGPDRRDYLELSSNSGVAQ